MVRALRATPSRRSGPQSARSASPTCSVYDTSRPASTSVALIKDLQYGQISDYVTPHGGTPGDTTTNLYVFPAGSLTKTQLLTGGNIDNSWFESGDQLTLGLFPSDLGFGIAEIPEAGSRTQGGGATATPSSYPLS